MDKKALLDELKIDRAETAKPRRPLKWFLALSVVAGIAYVAWAFGVPLFAAAEAQVRTVVARAAIDVDAGDSVLDATGYVVARRQATVSSKTTGKVLEVLIEKASRSRKASCSRFWTTAFRAPGWRWPSRSWEAARASLEEIRVNIRQAQLDVRRTRDLAERDLASQADLDSDELGLEGLKARLKRLSQDIVVAERALEVQSRELEDMRIRAPFGGVVIAKAAQPGEMISPVSAGGGFTRTGICTIVDMDSLEVEVDVNEAYINRVHAEQRATATLNAYPDWQIPAAVIATIPAADRNKATVRVRIAFLQRDPRILPDMGVKVAFLDDDEPAPSTASTPPGVSVPRAAVREEGGRRYLWVVVDDAVQRRMVDTGGTEGDRVYIVEGLAAGERVVAGVDEAVFASLRDGLRVSVVD